MLGTRAARRLGARVGGRVRVGGQVLRVVGVGLGPALNAERMGDDILVSSDGLAAVSSTAPFHEALVRVGPHLDRASVVRRLGADHEVQPRSPPPEVDNLGQLARLPEVLAAVLVAVAAVALGHAVVVITRRRRHDLAVLRALGLTATVTANAVVVMVLVMVAVGVVVGVPLGLGAGRVLWWVVADGTTVATDVSVPLTRVALLLTVGTLAAAAAASVPARRAARHRPGSALRAD
jgi:hypothetical protein